MLHNFEIKNASLNATVAPAEENVVSLGLGADGNGEFLDGIRSGVELFINRPSNIMTATIDKIPCNTDIQIYYISRYGFKAKTLVEQLVLQTIKNCLELVAKLEIIVQILNI